jgi:hypothetical protein
MIFSPCKKCIVRAMCKVCCPKKYEHDNNLEGVRVTAGFIFIIVVIGLLWAWMFIQSNI